MVEALGGGRLTPGVVRIGSTVRRPASSASAFTAALLTHLAAAGFDGAPRYLGRDEAGRDILSFLPGEVPAKWRAFDNGQVAAAGRLLRRLHESTRGLVQNSVVCHHDAGPNNTVFRDGRPVAFIDFDFAAAGDPLEDLGYLAWSWCISSKPSRPDPASQARQVRVLADAYEVSAAQRRALPAAIDARLVRNERFWGERPPAVVSGPPADEMLAWTRREMAFLREFREVFEAALIRQT